MITDEVYRKEQFYHKILEQFEEMKQYDGPIILFGSKHMGLIARKTLACFGRKVVCFCDNDAQKAGKFQDGLPVLSPDSAAAAWPDARVYICLFNEDNRQQVEMQLKEKGMKDIQNKDMLFWAYHTQVRKRMVNHEKYAGALYDFTYGKRQDALVLVPNVSAIITEKCTLRCAECGVFIPYYKNPEHHDTHKIIRSFSRLSEASDAIHILTLMGGEPFLHPELKELCLAAASLDQVLSVTLTTNGTIIPDDELLKVMSQTLSYITISDYGCYSRNKAALQKKLEQYGILYQVAGADMIWYKQNSPVPHFRDVQDNQKNFSECFWVSVAAKLIHGQYHLCDFSAGIAPFNKILDNQTDYVDVLDEALTDQELRVKLIELLNRKEPLKACDYCEIFSLPETERAVQTKEVLYFE